MSQARAEQEFDYAARGLTLSRARGRTLVGVTRDTSKIFSVYLASNGQAQFNFSTGKSATARWYVDSKDILCFKGLIKENPSKEICKLTKPRGRGMDWMTVELYEKNGKKFYRKATKDEHRGSSQIVYSFPGKHYVSKTGYQSNISRWKGRVVVGRTMKDREAWAVYFKSNGYFDFVFGSGRRLGGRYTTNYGEVCLKFSSKPEMNGCRKPTRRDGKVLWVSTKDGRHTSEIVYMTAARKKGTSGSSTTKPKKSTPSKAKPEQAVFVRRFGSEFMEVPVGHLPDKKFFVQVGMFKNTIRVIETGRGRMAAELRRKGQIVGWSLMGSRLIWAEKGDAFYLWDLADTSGFNIRKVMPAPSETVSMALDRSGNLLAVAASDSNELKIHDLGSGTVRETMTFDGFEEVRPLEFAANSPHLYLALDKSHVRMLNVTNGSYSDLTMQPDMTLRDFALSDDQKQAVMLEANADKRNGFVSAFRFDGAKWVLQKRVKMFGAQPGSAAISPDGAEVLVSAGAIVNPKGRAVYSYPLPGLASRDLVVSGKSGGAYYFGRKGDFIFASLFEKGTSLMARSKARSKLYNYGSGSYVFAAAGPVAEETARVEGEIAKEKAAYAEMLKEANRHYVGGNCSAYDALLGDLKKEDRKEEDCAAAKLKRVKLREFNTALDAFDCDTANNIRIYYDVGARSAVTACREKRQRRDDMLAFNLAKKNKDCTSLAEVEERLGRQGAASECRLEAALASDSPRKMFLTAVKFDTAGEFSNAKRVYEAIMERFPEDDVALQAATRVVTLTDQIRATEKADEQARKNEQALRAAQREAERAREKAAEAERAARREKEERERAEKKREREQKARQRKTERLAKVKRLMADMNAKYGLHKNYVSVLSVIAGRDRYYDISGNFKIAPVVQSPNSPREFCKVKIESSTYPRYSKINLPNNKYFRPDSGKSAFIVDLASKGRGVGTYQGSHLFKKTGERKVAFTTIRGGKAAVIDWAIPVQKLHQSGEHYKSGSRQTFIQVFSHEDPLFDDMNALASACYAARND